jgi:hypothetical protein
VATEHYYPNHERPKHSILGTLIRSAGFVVVLAIVATTAVVLYGMNMADRAGIQFLQTAREAVGNFPQFAKSLPPILSDVIRDERRPDYAARISVAGRLTSGAAPSRHGPAGPQVALEIRNNGTELVSLLSLRVCVRDADGTVLAEAVTWAATPIAGDVTWPGPLMAGATRQLAVRDLHYCGPISGRTDARVETEITDVRVWKPADAGSPTTQPEAG